MSKQQTSPQVGLTHTYGAEDDVDHDHGFEEAHGVTNKWIAGKILNSGASSERKSKFHSEMTKKGAAMDWAGKKGAASKRKFAADVSKPGKASGWDKWKSKGGK